MRRIQRLSTEARGSGAGGLHPLSHEEHSRGSFFDLLSSIGPALVFGLAFALSPCALAQDSVSKDAKAKDGRYEGDLQAFINKDAKDTATKLEVLQHSIDEVDQKITALTFMQLHGATVRMEKIWFPNVDKQLTPGYVFTPVKGGGKDAKPKKPGLVMVHGGFHYSFAEEAFGFVARAVKEGYVVIFPEYRGSKGYGAEQYRAIDFGGKEVDDVVWAADYLATRPEVDGKRLAIAGRSKGGMITLLALERFPKKFKAAACIVGIADFIAYMSYKPEYRRQDVARQPHFGGKGPFENLAAYMDASPMTHVEKIEAPLLIHATTGDQSVPVELHALRLIDALKANGKTFEHKIYDWAPGGHGYMQGESDAARDSMNGTFAFLNKYMQ